MVMIQREKKPRLALSVDSAYLNSPFHFLVSFRCYFEMSLTHVGRLFGIERISNSTQNKDIQLDTFLPFLFLSFLFLLQKKVSDVRL